MIKAGSRVKMNTKYFVSDKNKGKAFTVTAGPREVCGTICVWLDGYKGYYAIDGLVEVEA